MMKSVEANLNIFGRPGGRPSNSNGTSRINTPTNYSMLNIHLRRDG
jgi:hypothetical protein